MRYFSSTESKLKMHGTLDPVQKKEIMEYFKVEAQKHEAKQVKETFDVEFSFTADDIIKARAWEHDHHYKYDDVKPLLVDAFNAGIIECPRRQIF